MLHLKRFRLEERRPDEPSVEIADERIPTIEQAEELCGISEDTVAALGSLKDVDKTDRGNDGFVYHKIKVRLQL